MKHSFDFVYWVLFKYYGDPLRVRKEKTLSGIWIWFSPEKEGTNPDDFLLTNKLYDICPESVKDKTLKDTAVSFLEFLADEKIILYRESKESTIKEYWIQMKGRKKRLSKEEVEELYLKPKRDE